MKYGTPIRTADSKQNPDNTKCWGESRGTRTFHVFLVNVLHGTSQQKIVCYNVKYPFMSWTFGLCHFLAILMLLWNLYISLGYMPIGRIAGSFGKELLGCFPKCVHSYQQHMRVPFPPRPRQQLLCAFFLMRAILTDVKWHPLWFPFAFPWLLNTFSHAWERQF